MKILTKVYGSKENTIPFSVNKNTVYIRSDFQKIEPTSTDEAQELYSYDEIQYTKDEYITLLSQENENLKQQILDTQLALCEVYELFSL